MGTRRIESIWLAEGKEGKRLQQVKALAAARGTPIEIVGSWLLEVAGTAVHQGIVAFVASPPLLTLDELTSRLALQTPIPPRGPDGVTHGIWGDNPFSRGVWHRGDRLHDAPSALRQPSRRPPRVV